jgi:hypothetical protein
MKFLCLVLCAVVLLAAPAPAKIIIVNSTNNVATAAGQTNLVQALQLLQDGDTIHFNLPGGGPFYLLTPPRAPANGYPAITNHNITIDGYSQPGACPNTNTILGSNTARIQIVLDSRAGGMRVENIPGYSLGESSVLLIKAATNVSLRGLSFLGPGIGSGAEADPSTYAISFALGATNGHVNGCWFGIAPDRTNVFRFQDAVTGFQGAGESFPHNLVVGVEKNAPDAATARGQFNVIVGSYIPLALEGRGQRISGNFINVLPDGVSDYFSDGSPDHELQAFIEIGRSGDNLVLGTDGDGQNDAEERNIFGGVTFCDDFNLLEWYGASGKNMVIAGNYFGVGVDGVTRFTNSMTLLAGLKRSTTLRVGSDFDGVSDALEGNVISMNHPFNPLFPAPAAASPPDFSVVEYGATISFRGNTQLGAQLAPFTYADGSGAALPKLTRYCTNFFAAPLFPTLATNSTAQLLRGTYPDVVAPYTNLALDVYLADQEAWTNGQKFQFPELAHESGYAGFAAGHSWLASFDPQGPANLDPAPGQFAFDLSALAIPADALVTVAASYSVSAPGTHNAIAHTGPFALPVKLPTVPRLGIAVSGTNLFLTWPTNTGSFSVQTSVTLHPPAWANVDPPPVLHNVGTNWQAKIIFSGPAAFFRLTR